MLQELKRKGLSISAIALRTGLDRKTVRKHLDRGLAAPAYSPREPRPRRLEPYEGYLARKIEECPDLSGRRLFRQIQERGYEGGARARILPRNHRQRGQARRDILKCDSPTPWDLPSNHEPGCTARLKF